MLKIGGLGDLTGDVGGGYYLGKKVLASVYNALFKDHVKTLMTDIVLEMFEITSKYDYIDTITEKLGQGNICIKDLNKVIFMAANKGDITAKNILEDMGRDNAKAVNTLIAEMSFDDAKKIVLNGSIYVNGENEIAVNILKNDVSEKNSNKNINFNKLVLPPVTGAVIWALKEAGTELIYSKVTNCFANIKKNND